MSARNVELALQWLKKADHDLITARQTLLLSDGPTDTVCFHAQQAAEKVLKALLIFREISFPKTHDLIRLLEMCLASLPELEDFRNDLAEMSGYSVEVRYPDDWFEPSRDDAIRSLTTAEQLVARIRSELSQLPSN